VNRVSQLRRLCELRRLEEQNCAALLEEAKKRLEQLDQALSQSRERQQSGRSLMQESMRTGDLESRIAGIEEVASAKRKVYVLITMRHIVEKNVRDAHDQFFLKRKERFQAETLMSLALQEEAITAERRSQSVLDEWHRTTHRRPLRVVEEEEQSAESTRA
jgi:hypothetical protein